MIKIKDETITQRLEKIRERVGGKKEPFTAYPLPQEIDETISSIDEIERLFDPSGLLIKNRKPVFVYIRDHSFSMDISNPESLKKIHFTVCETLQSMKSQGRFERYHVTNRDDNQYPIDYARGKEQEVELYPCKNCLNKLGYKCFDMISRSYRDKIVKEFNAKEALDLMREQFGIFYKSVSHLRSEHVKTGYAKNHGAISRSFRQGKKYRCEECGVNLSSSSFYHGLCDMHHIDGNKRNNQWNNLKCLCKLCHKKEHSHYYVNDYDKSQINALRKRQRIRV